MTKHGLAAAALAAALVAAGCAGGGESNSGDGKTAAQAEVQPDDASKAIAKVDPCSLLTKDEIQQQLEVAGSPDQAAALKSKGPAWTITMQPEPRGVSRACEVHWQAAVAGDVHRQGDFTLVVTSAGWLTGSVAGMQTPLPIPNIGDEAYFVGGKSGPPYARVGKVAVGIENFPDTKEFRSGVGLLRLAVPRAQAAQ